MSGSHVKAPQHLPGISVALFARAAWFSAERRSCIDLHPALGVSQRPETGFDVYLVRVESRQDDALDAVALGPVDGPIRDPGAQATTSVVRVDVHVAEPGERRLVGDDACDGGLLFVGGID